MALAVFDAIEVVTFVFSLIAFIFILKAYLGQTQTRTSKRLWTYFLIIASLILLNRIFTNIEALFYRDIFNLLEHLSIVVAAIAFVYITRATNKGGTH